MAKTASSKVGASGRGLLLLALLFAAIAAFLVFIALERGGGGGDEASASDTAQVVVAAQDIPARTTLEGSMLKVVNVRTDSVITGTFSDTEALVGQITRYPLAENEQVSTAKVGTGTGVDKDDQGLSFVVPPGMRAFAVSVSEETGVGGMILPGDLVDVIAILKADLVGVDKAVTLVENVEVLAVAQEAQEPIPPSDAEGTATPEALGTSGERPEDVKPNPGAKTVTLAVTPEQAQLLALVNIEGEMALSLRSFGDRSAVSPPETNLTQYGAILRALTP
jgi:pilus assembly protein CpaB